MSSEIKINRPESSEIQHESIFKRILLIFKEGRFLTSAGWHFNNAIGRVYELMNFKQRWRLRAATSSLRDLKNDPLVSVILPAYNAESTIEKAVGSILHQSYQNIELLVVDDASTDNTIGKLLEINDPRLKIYRSQWNLGPYVCKNFGITRASGELIALQDADDISTVDRIELQVEYLKANKRVLFVEAGYQRINEQGVPVKRIQFGNVTAMFRKELIEILGYYDSVRVAADNEFSERIRAWFGNRAIGKVDRLTYLALTNSGSLTGQFKIGSEERAQYVKNFTDWHKRCCSLSVKPFIPFPLKERLFPVPPSINCRNIINQGLNHIFHYKKNTAWYINAAMATIPERVDSLKLTLKSIIDQVDKLYITLNGFHDIPDFLKHRKIVLNLSQEYDDYGSNGRFINSKNWSGFMIIIDDDIIYPENYVENLISAIQKYKYKAVVGVHGIIISDTFISYFEKSSRKVYHFKSPLKEDTPVHCLGCGTIAYHTHHVNFDLDDFDKNFMTDLYVAKKCQRLEIPMVAIQREREWLNPIPVQGHSLYETYKNNDSTHNHLVKSINWKINKH